jgi:hypothetical protein
MCLHTPNHIPVVATPASSPTAKASYPDGIFVVFFSPYRKIFYCYISMDLIDSFWILLKLQSSIIVQFDFNPLKLKRERESGRRVEEVKRRHLAGKRKALYI